MEKGDLHGQIESVWRRLFVAGIVICLTFPVAIVPWLKHMGVQSPDYKLGAWLWATTPTIDQEMAIAGAEFSTTTIVWMAVAVLVLGIFYFASKIKHLEVLESFRDEAEKRIRVEGYIKKELSDK